MAGAARDADLADDRENQVLGGDRRLQPAVHVDGERPRATLQQALRREHVADLGRADAEGEGTECTVRAGVAVAADDGLARLRRAQLRSDDVHDAAPIAAQAEQLDAEFRAVVLELANLLRRRLDRDRHAAEDLLGRVGVEWSIVPSVRPVRRTFRPRSRRTVKAWGEVTS